MCVSVESRLYIALASGCGPGKTKHWRRSSTGLTSCGPKQPQQPVITVCVCACARGRVCVCLDGGFTSADRWGMSMLSPCVEMLSLRPVFIWASMPAYVSVHTQTHYLSCVNVIHVYVCVCVCVQPVNYMGLAVGWKPREVWFVVCHHGCLGTAKAPGEIRANSTIFSLFGRVALILSFIARLAGAAKHRRRERSRVAVAENRV